MLPKPKPRRAAKAKRDYPPEVGGSNIPMGAKGTRRMTKLKRGRSKSLTSEMDEKRGTPTRPIPSSDTPVSTAAAHCQWPAYGTASRSKVEPEIDPF